MLENGATWLQEQYNQSSMRSLKESIAQLDEVLAGNTDTERPERGTPLYVFGNVLPEPEFFTLIGSCGGRVAAEDLCTGSRLFGPLILNGTDKLYQRIARGLLSRVPCARTVETTNPGGLGEQILQSAQESGAKGVIGYTIKFCDPYLSRMPVLRKQMKQAGMPLLVLEGDCTMRSLGQHRTRIEAFIEMLG